MQNQELGRHSDKIWADSTTKYNLKYLTTSLADLPNRFGIFRKTELSLGVRSPWSQIC